MVLMAPPSISVNLGAEITISPPFPDVKVSVRMLPGIRAIGSVPLIWIESKALKVISPEGNKP